MNARARVGLAISMLLTVSAGTGCHSGGAPKVDCEKHLQPINAPAPKVKEESTQKPGAAPSSSAP